MKYFTIKLIKKLLIKFQTKHAWFKKSSIEGNLVFPFFYKKSLLYVNESKERKKKKRICFYKSKNVEIESSHEFFKKIISQ